MCAAGTGLSTLCPRLFSTACTGGIIGTLNYLKTAGAHYHKYSLDVLLRSTVRTQGSGCDFMASLCVCVCVDGRVCTCILSAQGLIDGQYLQTKHPPISQHN